MYEIPFFRQELLVHPPPRPSIRPWLDISNINSSDNAGDAEKSRAPRNKLYFMDRLKEYRQYQYLNAHCQGRTLSRQTLHTIESLSMERLNIFITSIYPIQSIRVN